MCQLHSNPTVLTRLKREQTDGQTNRIHKLFPTFLELVKTYFFNNADETH